MREQHKKAKEKIQKLRTELDELNRAMSPLERHELVQRVSEDLARAVNELSDAADHDNALSSFIERLEVVIETVRNATQAVLTYNAKQSSARRRSAYDPLLSDMTREQAASLATPPPIRPTSWLDLRDPVWPRNYNPSLGPLLRYHPSVGIMVNPAYGLPS